VEKPALSSGTLHCHLPPQHTQLLKTASQSLTLTLQWRFGLVVLALGISTKLRNVQPG